MSPNAMMESILGIDINGDSLSSGGGRGESSPTTTTTTPTPHPFWTVFVALPGIVPPPPPEVTDKPPLLSALYDYCVSIQQSVYAAAPPPPTTDAAASSSSLAVGVTNATFDELWAMLTSTGPWANRHPLWIQYSQQQTSLLTEHHWKVVVPLCLFFFVVVVLPCSTSIPRQVVQPGRTNELECFPPRSSRNHKTPHPLLFLLYIRLVHLCSMYADLVLLHGIRRQWIRWRRKHRHQRNYEKAVIILKQHCSHQLTESDFVHSVGEEEEKKRTSNADAASFQASTASVPLARLWQAFFPEVAAAHRHHESRNPRRLGPPMAVVQCRLPATMASSPGTTTTTTTRQSTLDECCSICLHKYECHDTIVWSPNPQCTHLFHQACLLRWLRHSPRFPCPVCRRQYVIAIPPRNPAKPPNSTTTISTVR